MPPGPETSSFAHSIRAWWTRENTVGTELALIAPVFVLYHLGILLIPARNGVDLISPWIAELLQYSTAAYVFATLALGIGLLYAATRDAKVHPLQLKFFVPTVAESLVWAGVVTLAVGRLTQELIGWTDMQVGVAAFGPGTELILSAGAGLHEELVFRAGLFGGVVFICSKLAKRRAPSIVVSVAIASAFLFALIHYIGPFGDTFRIGSFVFRMLFGLALTGIYVARGFAVAVWTHFLYDVIYFWILA